MGMFKMKTVSQLNRKNFWEYAAAAAVSGAMSYLSSERATDQAKGATALSYGRYKRRYRDTVKDMRAAGLNPILAASGGFDIGNSVGPSQVYPANMSNFDLSSTAKNFAEAGLMEEQQMESISRQGLNAQKSLTEVANREKLETEERKLFNESISYMQAANKYLSESNLNATQVEMLNLNIKQLKLNMEKLGKTAHFWNHEVVGKVLGFIKVVTEAFGFSSGIYNTTSTIVK
jgi:hypothetical protein